MSIRYLLWALFLGFCIPLMSPAQSSERDKSIEVDTINRLDPELRDIKNTNQQSLKNGEILHDFGAFTRSIFLNYDDGTSQWLASRINSLRVWHKASYGDTFTSYFRLKTSRLDIRRGDSFTGEHSRRSDPKLDLGYFNIGNARCHPVTVQVGRSYVSQGSGVAVSKVLDGVIFDFTTPNVSGFAYRGRNPSSDNNQNAAAPGFKNSKRYFNGLELNFNSLFDSHQPYFGYVRERDHSEESFIDLAQNYDSDFDTYLIGTRGAWSANWRYSLEFLRQIGRVARPGAAHNHSNQSSRAFLFNTQYILEEQGVILEYDYKYGRGDNDRTSVTSVGASSSSNVGSTDTNFFYFGYTDTGLVLAPRLSNIHINHLGLVWNPPTLEQWEFQIDGYNFQKDMKRAFISDDNADRARYDIGREADFRIEFRPYSNVSVATRYGVFFRGGAYAGSATREYWRFDLALDF